MAASTGRRVTRRRQLRRWLTANAVYTARRLAPLCPEFAIRLLQRTFAVCGPRVPLLASTVRRNMQAAGVFDVDTFRDYFSLAASHLLNGVRIYKNHDSPDRILDMANREVSLDESILELPAKLDGKGAVLVPVHCSNFLISLARLNESLPLCLYLRWSSDPRKVEMKRTWCAAIGIEVVVEPPNMTDPTSRAAACVEILRSGKMLVITPDIVQRVDEGVPVRVVDHLVHLPSGPASLAMLAEVPMIPLFSTARESKQHCYVADPITVSRLGRADGGRPEAMRRAMQEWAESFTRYLRNWPESWFLWGDSRWARLFQGDPKYARQERREGEQVTA